MRWTDLPPDPGPADGRASALPRGEWEDLRRRLERLPEGHPSRPDDAAGAAAAEELAAEELADEDGGPPERPEPVDPGNGQDPEPQRGARGRGAADGGHPRPGGLGDLGRGGREPYRPWFTEGQPPEPWFTEGEPPEPWFASEPG